MDVLQAKEYFFNLHDVEVNQKYGDKPYSYHLKQVYEIVERFLHLIEGPTEQSTTALRQITLITALGHDSIEDARLSYNDVSKLFGGIVADRIFTLTEYRGKNRRERHPPEYYREIFSNQVTTLVKLADYLANTNAKVADGNQNAIDGAKGEFYLYLTLIPKYFRVQFKDLIKEILNVIHPKVEGVDPELEVMAKRIAQDIITNYTKE